MWPNVLQWAEKTDKVIDDHLLQLAVLSQAISEKVISTWLSGATKEFLQNIRGLNDLLKEYDKAHEHMPTFTYWRKYMDLVTILLAFTRALRSDQERLLADLLESQEMRWMEDDQQQTCASALDRGATASKLFSTHFMWLQGKRHQMW